MGWAFLAFLFGCIVVVVAMFAGTAVRDLWETMQRDEPEPWNAPVFAAWQERFVQCAKEGCDFVDGEHSGWWHLGDDDTYYCPDHCPDPDCIMGRS